MAVKVNTKVKAKTVAKGSYDEDAIKWYKGLEGVRKKPGMYIGSVDNEGLFQATKEIVDNACDEALAGHNTEVGVVITDKSISVYDHGRGIPVGAHPKNPSRSTLEIVFTELHSGGKMESSEASYGVSKGTHGVGSAVTVALSEKFQVWTYRKGWYTQTYQKGVATTKVTKAEAPKVPGGTKPLTKGTLITFTPDKSIFKSAVLDTEKVRQLLVTNSYFIAGCTFKFWDQTTKGSKVEVFKQTEGMTALCDAMLETVKAEAVGPAFVYQDDFIDVLLQWSSYEDELSYSYCNASLTASGGTHTLGLQRVLKEVLEKYAGVRQADKFRSEDIRNGLLGVVNVKVGAPSFDSQTKERLTTPITDNVIEVLRPQLEAFFNKNKNHAKAIVSRAVEIRKAQQEFNMNKKAVANLKTTGRGRVQLPVKLSIAKTKDPEERELFLVEGESAGGSAKVARDKNYQEVLALKGKPPNPYRAKEAAIIGNEVVLAILQSIGYDPSFKDPLEKLRIKNKIIILADPDPDGYHINGLVLALLNRIVPQVIDMGMVYIVDAPLYMGRHGKSRIFGKSLNDVKSKLPKNASAECITRIKGWGEVNADVLREIAFDPKTRKLTKINPVKSNNLKRRYVELVGEDTEARRELMGFAPKSQNGNVSE